MPQLPDPRRHLADLLSASNAFFGVASCFFALQGRPDVSLVLLIAGAVCDGLDGAAARRFGGTRFGVLADDVADAISYGVAPAIAVAIATSGVEGTAVGVVYGALTLTRLVFFTLRKGLPGDDPATFRGLPSTVGAVIVLCAAILWPAQPTVVAFFAGVAVTLMVGFDAGFAHLGRSAFALPAGRRLPVLGGAVVVLAFAAALGPAVLASALLAGALPYAVAPHVAAFRDVLRARRAPGASETHSLP